MSTTTQTQVKAVDASYYTVKDLDGQTKFYTSVLGADPTLTIPDMIAEWTFPGGGSFGLYKSERNVSSGTGVLFAVEDVPAAVAEVKALGATVEGQDESPVCHMAFVTDPEGLMFILHHRKDGTCG